MAMSNDTANYMNFTDFKKNYQFFIYIYLFQILMFYVLKSYCHKFFLSATASLGGDNSNVSTEKL